MEGSEGDKGTQLETLPPIDQPNYILRIVKKIGLRTLAWVGVYLLGYFDFSIAWMVTPLVLSVVRDEWKKDKRNRLAAAREAALSNEKAMVEARFNMEELPTWVFFPDRERAEWLNNIIKRLWPYVNEYVRNTLFHTVEPVVEEALKGFKLSPFKFERDRVFLGQVPPRITGIKVYDTNVNRKEIIMDVDIVYASDLEIVFKVKGISAKVSDFGLRGMARIVLKPLINEIPLIGGVQVYFLKSPEIDYNLGGVAGALEIPGLSRIVERIIIEQIKNFIVLPNKFTLPLVDSIPNKVLKCPDSAGVLRVKMIQAKNLVNLDGVLSGGKSDPYVILTVGAHTFRLPSVTDCLNPVWETNNVFDFPIEVVQGQELLMEFYDEENRRDDEFMGRAKIQTSIVAERGHIESRWIDLVDGETGQGQVQVSLSWLQVSRDSETVKVAAKFDNDDNAKGLVHLYIDSCEGLISPRDPSYTPSPMVRIISPRPNEKSQTTWPKYNTHDPIIEQGFVAIIRRPYTDELKIEVIDTAGKKDQVLGTCTINVWRDLVEQQGMEQPLRPWILKGNCPKSRIVMSASLRGLLPPAKTSPRKAPTGSQRGSPEERRDSLVESPSLDSSEPVTAGRVRLSIHKAKELEKKDVTGKSDPYIVINYDGLRVGQTKVVKKSLNPSWEEEFSLDITEGGQELIELAVFDKDKVGKDESLGSVSVDIRRVIRLGSLSQVWSQLKDCKSGDILWSAEWTPEDIQPLPDTEVPQDSVITEPEPEIVTELKPYQEPEPGRFKESVVSVPVEEESPKNTIDVGEVPPIEDKELVVVTEEIVATESLGKVRAGFLKVTVHSAKDLISKDLGGGSDPYVVIRYDGQKSKSKHVKNELNPELEFTTGYVTEDDGPSDLVIEMKDHDIVKNESLGSCKFDLRKVMSGNNLQMVWTDLVGVKSGKVLVSIDFTGSGYNDAPEENIELTMEETSTVPDDDKSELRQRNVANRGKVRLNLLYDTNKEELKMFLHEAQNLPGGDLPDPPDPQVKVYLMPGKKKKKKSDVVKDCVDPKFNEEFDFSIDFQDLKNMWLKVSVVDKKGVFSKSPVLGTVDIQLSDPGLQSGVAGWYPLQQSDEDEDD